MKKFLQFTQVFEGTSTFEMKTIPNFDDQVRKTLNINQPGRGQTTYEIEHMSQSSSFSNTGKLFIVTSLVINISNPV